MCLEMKLDAFARNRMFSRHAICQPIFGPGRDTPHIRGAVKYVHVPFSLSRPLFRGRYMGGWAVTSSFGMFD